MTSSRARRSLPCIPVLGYGSARRRRSSPDPKRGGFAVVPALAGAGALMLWTGPGALWTALPAPEPFRPALQKGASAVGVDGAGPDELYLQRAKLERLLEPADEPKR